MPVKYAGESWFRKYHHNDEMIKKINSPGKAKVKVLRILDKDAENYWILAKIEYGGKEVLGIRWFYDNNGASGYPNSRGWATWLVIDKSMAKVLSNNSHISDFCK